MKKRITFITLLIILLFVVIFFVTSHKSYSLGTVYRDWSEVSILDEDYSYSTVFLTEQTEFKVLKNDGTIVNDGSYFRSSYIRDELVLLITNCAVNKEGQLMDVLIRINNIKKFANFDDGYITFLVRSSIQVPKSQLDPYDYDTINITNNMPLVFTFSTLAAQADFSMTYYLAGTYNSSNSNNRNVLGNITSLNGIYYDFDALGNAASANELFKGNEGIIPTSGNAQIFYNKNNKGTGDPSLKYVYQEEENGIALKEVTRNGDMNTAWFGSSVFVVADNLKNSTYSFTYSGRNCGIWFMFASPYPFEISNPIKSVNVESVGSGDRFVYSISQNVPNNYYSSSLGFGEVYPNLYNDTKFSELIIRDILDNNLLINQSEIKIISEAGASASKYFNINVQGNTITATATNAALNSPEFYAHTYTIQIPVTLKSGIKNISEIKNVASTDSKIADKGKETKKSNETTIKVKYKLTVNFYDESGNKIDSSIVSLNNYGYRYDTNYSNIDTKIWKFVRSTNNTSGTLTEDTVVDYYFKKADYKLVVNYYDVENNQKIVSSDEYTYNYNDSYATGYSKIDSKAWKYVKTDGDAVSGKITKDTQVNYYFEKQKYKLTVNYYDSEGNKIAVSDEKQLNYNDTYKTDYSKVDSKVWRYVRTSGDAISGTITKNIEVNYYFERVEYNLTVNYYNVSNNQKIDDSDESLHYYGIEYKTNYNKIDNKVWKYVKTDGDAVSGTITKNTEVNYYFERVEYKLTVNYYDIETNEKIASSDESFFSYNDMYATDYKKVDSNKWEYVKATGDAINGNITKDTEVNYYFKCKEYRLIVKYYDEETNEEIIDSKVISHKYGDKYETDYDDVDNKIWEYVKIDGEAFGTISDDTEVSYYFRKREYKLIVNYYEEGTENKIEESNESFHHYEDEYITDYEKIDSKIWEIVEVPDNYQGKIIEDTELNYYFRKKAYKLIVNYYEDGTNKKIANSEERIYHYNDEYMTDYSKINGDEWELIKMPDNFQGIITGDIIVNYYFRGSDIKNPSTGISLKFIVPLVLILISLLLIYKSHRKKLFKI